MAITKAMVFTSTDGKEFETEEAALRHDKLITAKNAYEQAQIEFGLALAESCRTADGALFKMNIYRHYWSIWAPIYQPPRLHEIPYVGHGWRWKEYGETIAIAFDYRDPFRTSEPSREITFNISEIYQDKRNAEIALVAALKKYREDVDEYIAEAEKAVSNAR